MRSLTFFALACLAIQIGASTDEEWQQFKVRFGKSYKTQKEEALRRNIFYTKLRRIQAHNLEADFGRHSFRLGINKYSDLSFAEYRKFRMGYRHNNSSRIISTFLPPLNVKLPSTVDWRKKGYVTKVKDQGDCGSCWAFSSTGALEGQHFRKTGRLVSLSEQNLVDCTNNKKYGNEGCKGGCMVDAFQYIMDNKGIDTEVSYPYEERDGYCRYNPDKAAASDSGSVGIKSGDENALKIAVATIGPISVGIDASSDSFADYKSGVYVDSKCSNKHHDHAVLVVGYGKENGQDYWLVKNSWGESWGEKGYIKMARNRNNMCAIASEAIYPLV